MLAKGMKVIVPFFVSRAVPCRAVQLVVVGPEGECPCLLLVKGCRLSPEQLNAWVVEKCYDW